MKNVDKYLDHLIGAMWNKEGYDIDSIRRSIKVRSENTLNDILKLIDEGTGTTPHYYNSIVDPYTEEGKRCVRYIRNIVVAELRDRKLNTLLKDDF